MHRSSDAGRPRGRREHPARPRRAEHPLTAALVHLAQAQRPRDPDLSQLQVTADGPGIFLPVSRLGYHGLSIALKADAGPLRPARRHQLLGLIDGGYAVSVEREPDRAFELLLRYLHSDRADLQWLRLRCDQLHHALADQCRSEPADDADGGSPS